MPVLLRRSSDCPDQGWAEWVAIGAASAGRDPARQVAGLADQLEKAFDAVLPDWLAEVRPLGDNPSAVLAHTPSAAPNASDFGLMLAWTRLVEQWAAAPAVTLALCDDPWLFRHLAGRPGVESGRAPSLLARTIRLVPRGWVARLSYAASAALAARRLAPQRSRPPSASPWLLVYGHPYSDRDGGDAYFGDLMRRLPGLRRMLHVDCPPSRGRALFSSVTYGLHGWGSAAFALTRLPFSRWRPRHRDLAGANGWLVRRAAAIEGGTAQAAAVRWQIHCQRRWLAAVSPSSVAWPWENHGWERDFCRAAAALGVTTIGYQHSVVGRQMLNYAAKSNSDAASLPSRVLCSGQATLDQLALWGFPPARLAVGGALRFAAPKPVPFDADAPVFLALPFDQVTARQMVVAAFAAAKATGRRFVVKDHPMTPFAFADGDGITHTTQPLGQQPAVSAVVYAATTVGLEALLAGLPTLRFCPAGRIALDILPAGVTVPTTSAATLAVDLAGLGPPIPPSRESIFGTVDPTFWAQQFGLPLAYDKD